jgi:hypothetical protein
VNWFAGTQIRQQNWWHGLVSKQIRWNTYSLVNWFAAYILINELIRCITGLSVKLVTQNHQRTDSLEHRFISKLIRCNTNSSANHFAAPQPGERTDSLKHRLVRELIYCNAGSSAKLVTWTRQRTDLLKHRLVRDWFAAMQVHQRNWWHVFVSATDSLEHIFISELIRCNTN